MLQQVTKDLLWKRGRAPRACSWRWWGTGQHPGWWWSRACPRHSRREKKGPAECWECFWPLRVGCWQEFGAPTARSSPSPSAITELPQGSPRSPDSGLCKCCSLCPGCGPPNLGQDALIPSSCYWGDLHSNRDSSWEDPGHMRQRQWVHNNWKRKPWTLVTRQHFWASRGLPPVFLWISWDVNMISLLSSRQWILSVEINQQHTKLNNG